MFLSATIENPGLFWTVLVGFLTPVALVIHGLVKVNITNKMDDQGFRWAAILVIAGLFILLFVQNPLGILLEAAGIVVYAYLYMQTVRRMEEEAEREARKREERRQQRQKEIGGTSLDRFYVECVLARCTDLSVPKNMERAKLLANKYRVYSSEGMEDLLRQAREKHGTIGEKLRAERLAALRELEKRAYRDSMEYAAYRGREKMRVMLTHSIQTMRRASTQIIDNAADRAPTLEKEHNWGVWGGIADGLAGPGAGVAAALDTQRQNAQIRERNEMKLNATLGLWTLAVMDAAEITRKADSEQQILDRLPEKLLDDKIPSQDVFALLGTPQDVKVEVSETGAFRVTASLSAKQHLKMYEDVDAIVDGTILAHVYEDGQHVGTATMVLPKRGVSSYGKVPVMGIGLSGVHPDKKQTVQFEAGNLWLIEF